jgi:hypothetical protein
VSQNISNGIPFGVLSIEMIECLLSNGADPNHVFRDEYGAAWTVWQRMLPLLVAEFDGKNFSPLWKRIATAMIKARVKIHKADLEALLNTSPTQL